MTIQNWELRDGVATVVCDSLWTDGETGAPCGLDLKFWVLPEPGIIIAAKNLAWPGAKLFSYWQTNKVRDLRAAIAGASSIIRAAWLSRRLFDDDDRTRVIVFGIHAGAVEGWQFDSADGFNPRPFTGRQLIPPIDGKLAESDDWLSIARKQQEDDLRLPPSERDNIGGPLMMLRLRVRGGGVLSEGEPALEIRKLADLPIDWAGCEERSQPGDALRRALELCPSVDVRA